MNEGNPTKSSATPTMKVSEKGGLSIYGVGAGRLPVTLYKDQWEKILGMTDEIKAFIRANDAALKIATPKTKE